VTRDLVLVRHAMPEIVGGVSPEWWHLGPEGRAAARALAARLDRQPRVVTSHEVKARETAEEIVVARGGTLALDRRLGEVARPLAPDGETDRALARRYLGGEALDGWEPHAEVVARFAAAATDAEVVVTHGLAMTLYLAPSDPVRFWEELTFPDAWRYSALAGHLRRVH
jgi:broad specificity phosphatase PhoE